ncbi:MAG: hypothetical protein JW737_09765 [Acidobacteria bacterium]|nr:hypothetical protein [Acidobacteriota bacterium]
MKKLSIKIIFIFLSILITLLLASCSLNSTIIVTIYNNTPVTSGTLTILYGDYNGYADGEISITDPVFPYTASLTCSGKTPSYIVMATLESSTFGTSFGSVFVDTKSQNMIETVINLEPYIILGTDIYEPDNTFNTGHPIQPGEWQARNLYPSGDVDYSKFYATSGLIYDIVTDIPYNDYFATTIVIFDSIGTQITRQSGSSSGTVLNWTATYTGLCYLKVSRNYGYDYSYSLGLFEYSAAGSSQNILSKLKEWRSQ